MFKRTSRAALGWGNVIAVSALGGEIKLQAELSGNAGFTR
jgi:hypothetical protein